MANKYENIISLEQAEGVKNYFIGKWKKIQLTDGTEGWIESSAIKEVK